jgi:hypothetical protein
MRMVAAVDTQSMKRAAATVVSIGAIALVGCGSGAQHAVESAPASAPIPTKTTVLKVAPKPPGITHAQFIARADAVCARAHRNLRPWQRKTDAATTLAQLAGPARRIVPIAARMASDLSGLTPPRADAKIIDRYTALVRRQAADIRKISRAASAGDAALIQTLGRLQDDYIARQTGIAEGFGLKVCGRPGK